VATSCLERTRPAPATDRRRVEALSDAVKQLGDQVKPIRGPLDENVSALDAWISPRRA